MPSSSPSSEGAPTQKPVAAVLIIRSGARTGQRHQLSADFATLGRHESSDLQFDPDLDREASARHAAVFRQGPTYVVRDLGSRNGTWVNGERIRSDRPLEAGDLIRLGPQGPEVEFTLTSVEDRPTPLIEGSGRAPAEEPSRPTRPDWGPSHGPSPGSPEGPTNLRIRMEVVRQTDRLRRRIGAGILAGLVVVGTGVGWLVYRSSEHRRAIVAEQERLTATLDSLQRALSAAGNRTSALQLALDSARLDADALRQRIALLGETPESLAALERRIVNTVTQHGRLIEAADLDVSDLHQANASAVVMVIAEYLDGRSVSATGFVARSAGDTGWIVTSRHAVTDEEGRLPRRLVAGLPGRPNVYRATVTRLHDTLDLAILQMTSRQGVPSVSRVDDRGARIGDPAALIGYPLGLDLAQAGRTEEGTLDLSPSTLRATVSRIRPDVIQLDGYGVAGASGSPVFSVTGAVIGMLYGGEPGTGGRIIYAVPAARILETLDRE